MKQNNINDVIENKDIISQYTEEAKDNNGSSAEELQVTEDITDSLKADTETKVASDKDVNQGITTEEKLAEMQDRYLRLSAEFDNYRKRTLRGKNGAY